jgi:hypothetical protein
LVLVPAGFVAEQAEIIVLDGGTDIIAHGRHAEVVASDPETGLALLKADGLWRTGVTLSDSSITAGRELTLHAYPPAQSIAAGEAPLLIPASLSDKGMLNAGTDAHLPNVTGALLDSCGHLVALRVADGAQGHAPAPAATLIGLDDLAAAVEAENPGVERASCALPTETGQARPATEQLPIEEPASTSEPVQSSTEKTPRTLPSPITPSSPVTIEPAGEDAPESSQYEQPAESSVPEKWDAAPAWLLPAVLLVLVVLAWRFAIINRNRRAARNGPVQPASDEPATLRLAGSESDSEPVMRSGRGSSESLPGGTGLPEGCNGLVVLENPTGEVSEPLAFCAVNLDEFEIVAGRGSAEMDVSHPAVSRRHARITGSNDLLTIEDLGSSNGTYIDRVPCLPGEVVHLEAGMEIWLGELHCRITLLGEEQLAP